MSIENFRQLADYNHWANRRLYAVALALPDAYYADLAAMYRRKRDRLMRILTDVGFVCFEPKGAYYIMVDASKFGFPDDVALARHLVTEIGVASVPGSSFFHDPALGRQRLRFCFCKKDETIAAGEARLAKLDQLRPRLA